MVDKAKTDDGATETNTAAATNPTPVFRQPRFNPAVPTEVPPTGFKNGIPGRDPAKILDQTGREFKQGNVFVRTNVGRAFQPRDTALPLVDEDGVRVSRAQADRLVNESGGLVYEVKES